MPIKPTPSAKDVPSAYPNQGLSPYAGRVKAFTPNPQVEAILRKLVPDIERGTASTAKTANGEITLPDPAYLKQISATIAQDTTDATSLKQLLPDMELVESLLIAGIMSPKDLTNGEISFSVDPSVFDLPVTGELLDVIREAFTTEYDLKALAPKMLRKALFESGSYPAIIIPENSLDELINGQAVYSNESVTKLSQPLYDPLTKAVSSLRFLGEGVAMDAHGVPRTPKARSSVSLEALTPFSSPAPIDPHPATLGAAYAPYVSIVDNFNLLKVPLLKLAKQHAQVRDRLYRRGAPGLESGNYDYVLGGKQMNASHVTSSIIQTVRTKDMISRPTVGNPLVLAVPSESVIPIFINKDEHLGYFILLDQDGNFLSTSNRRDIYNDLSVQDGGAGSSLQGSSQMIQMAKNLSIGVNPVETKDSNKMVHIYGELLERELKTRLANGLGEGNFALGATDEIYRIMFARSMHRAQTQILYVPSELMVYAAFDYADNGTGRSLVEKSKIIGSMRAMLTFSGLMAGIKNSVSRQSVNIEVSENDPDKAKTVARIMDEYTRRRNVTMPFVASDPADMISYLNMAGVEFNVTGSGIPQTKVNVEDKVSNRAHVDKELSDELRDRHYMAFNLTPEMVTQSNNADFATTLILQNQMTAKRILQMQEQFEPHLEKFVKTVTTNSALYLNRLRKAVRQALDSIKEEAHEEAQDKADAVDQGTPAPGDQTTDAAKEKTPAPAPPPAPAKPESTLSEEDKTAAVERIVFAFIDAIQVRLPRPDTQTITAQAKAFDDYADALDKALATILDPAFLTDGALGDLAGRLDEVKASLRAYYLRRWISSNGFLTELTQIYTLNEEGTPEGEVGKEAAKYAGIIAKTMEGYLEGVGPVKRKIGKALDALNLAFPEANLTQATSPSGGDGGFGGSDTGTDTGDQGGGGDGDLGGDSGLPPDITAGNTAGEAGGGEGDEGADNAEGGADTGNAP